MIITCPRCETTFSLPDELYRPGKKARCSSCGNLFAMPAADTEDVPTSIVGETAAPFTPAPAPAPKKGRLLAFVVTLVLLALFAYGGYLIFKALFSAEAVKNAAGGGAAVVEKSEPDGKKQEQLVNFVSLEEIRQFLVDNVEVGKLMVIQGFAVNSSESPKDYISVEARILDERNTVLARTQQLCGVPLTLFQLQTLPEKDLKETLANRTTILVNNTNVPPGGKVPFVVIFPNPPEKMRTFEVQVVDVRESPAQ